MARLPKESLWILNKCTKCSKQCKIQTGVAKGKVEILSCDKYEKIKK
jgi:hypothetical protein